MCLPDGQLSRPSTGSMNPFTKANIDQAFTVGYFQNTTEENDEWKHGKQHEQQHNWYIFYNYLQSVIFYSCSTSILWRSFKGTVAQIFFIIPSYFG